MKSPIPDQILSWAQDHETRPFGPMDRKREGSEFPFYSLFTVDLPGKSPIVTQRKGMLVAWQLIRYPPETRTAPRMEAVFSPYISHTMATRGPWGKKKKLVLCECAPASCILTCSLNEQLKENRRTSLGILCVLQKSVWIGFLTILEKEGFLFLFFKERIVNKQVWRGSLLKMHCKSSTNEIASGSLWLEQVCLLLCTTL